MNVNQLHEVTAALAVGRSTPHPDASSAGVDSSSVSGPAALVSRLEELKAADPAAFQRVVGEIAEGLTLASRDTESPELQKMMTDLAATFSEVSKTGDLVPLKRSPVGGPPTLPPEIDPKPASSAHLEPASLKGEQTYQRQATQKVAEAQSAVLSSLAKAV